MRYFTAVHHGIISRLKVSTSCRCWLVQVKIISSIHRWRDESSLPAMCTDCLIWSLSCWRLLISRHNLFRHCCNSFNLSPLGWTNYTFIKWKIQGNYFSKGRIRISFYPCILILHSHNLPHSFSYWTAKVFIHFIPRWSSTFIAALYKWSNRIWCAVILLMWQLMLKQNLLSIVHYYE